MRYELKARSVSEILDGTFKIYRDHFWPLFAIAAIGAVPTALFDGVAGWVTHAAESGSYQRALPALLALLAAVPLVLLAATLETCALTCATVDAYLGRPFTAMGSIGRALSLFPSLLWAGLLFYLGVGAGFVLLIIPGFYLTLIWAVWLQALVVENARGSAALGRSRALTRGGTGRLGWLLLVFVLLQLALLAGFKAAIPAKLEDIPILAAVLEQLPNALIVPIYPALLTLFYFDGRIRHEGYDLELQAAEGLPAAGSALP
ncbi:MAG: hypothetical protein ACYDCL_18100 [Myxococcales bacterium]